LGDRTVLQRQQDREVDHGEEGKGEEKICEKEEGRSGRQEEKSTEGGTEKVREEEAGKEGRPQAQGGAEAQSGSDGCANAGV
jgi:hypothetical protein